MHVANPAKPLTQSLIEETDVVRIAKAIGDPLRANVLRVMARDSFAVQELGEAFAMSQPAISHHLKILAAAGLVTKRREGTTIFYQRTTRPDGSWVAGLFRALDAEPKDKDLARRINRIHKARQQRTLDFFATEADALAQQTTRICDPSVYQNTVLECLNDTSTRRDAALEVGPGSGTLLTSLAAIYTSVIGVDPAGQMLERARLTTETVDNVHLIEQDFNQLPAETKYDAVVAAMVLHHMPSPSAFFQQAARVLSDGGLLIVAELCDHSFDWVRDLCGDVWLGFEPEELTRWARDASFTTTRHQFLAQRNGFRVQVAAFTRQTHTKTGNLHV